MNNTKRSLESLKGKTLLNLIFKDKTINDEDNSLVLEFSENYKLKIQTFWRIFDKNKILAMESERYLLPDFNAPEKDFQKLSYNKSLLCKNLRLISEKCINSRVVNVDVSDTSDCIIQFNNSFKIQIIITCRSNGYMYYGLFHKSDSILEVRFDWNNLFYGF